MAIVCVCALSSSITTQLASLLLSLSYLSQSRTSLSLTSVLHFSMNDSRRRRLGLLCDALSFA